MDRFGRTRSRRLGALLAGALLVVTIAGCTVGTTSIAAGQTAALIPCTAGPTPGTFWVAGPGASRLRFQVRSSDATQPLGAAVFRLGPDGSAFFGTVWDGSKSTGPKEIPLPGWSIPLMIYPENGAASETIQADWVFTALDPNGKDVGFSCEG